MAGIWEKMSQLGGSLFGSTGDDGTFNRGKLEELMMNPLFSAGASMYDGRGFGPGFAQAQGLQQRDAQLEAFAAERERQKMMDEWIRGQINPGPSQPQGWQPPNVNAMLNAPLNPGAAIGGDLGGAPPSMMPMPGLSGNVPFSEPQQAPVAQPQQAGPQAGGSTNPYLNMLRGMAMYGDDAQRMRALETLFEFENPTPGNTPADIQWANYIASLGPQGWKYGDPFTKAQEDALSTRQSGRLDYDTGLQDRVKRQDMVHEFMGSYAKDQIKLDDAVTKLEKARELIAKAQTGPLGPLTVLTDTQLQVVRGVLDDLGLDALGQLDTPLTPVSDEDFKRVANTRGGISNNPAANLELIDRQIERAQRVREDMKIMYNFYTNPNVDVLSQQGLLYQQIYGAEHRKGNPDAPRDNFMP